MKIWRFATALAVIGAGRNPANCQTRINLATQGRSIDFSTAPSTKPFKTGPALPQTCAIGEVFFSTSALPGQNLFTCTAANTWTPQNAAAVQTVFGRVGAVAPQAGDYTASQVTDALDKTVANTYPAGAKQTFTASASLTGIRVTPSALPSIPQAGDLAIDASDWNKLKFYNGTSWVAAVASPPAISTVFGRIGTVVPQAGDYTAAQVTNAIDKTAANVYSAGAKQTFTPSVSQPGLRVAPAALPSSPQAGDMAVDSFDSNKLKFFDGTSWLTAAGAGTVGSLVTSVFGRIGAVVSQSGDYTASQVTNAVDKTAPSVYTAGAKQTFTPSGTLTGLRVAPGSLPTSPQSGDIALDGGDGNKLKYFDGSVWVSTVPVPPVTSIFGRTGAITPQTGDYTAAQVTNAVDKSTANTYPAGARQTFTASATQPGLRVAPAVLPSVPQSGDLAVDASDANKLKYYDGSSWITAASGKNFGVAFTTQTTLVITGAAHGLGTANLVVACYDTAVPANQIEPDAVTVHPTTYDVTVRFSSAQSGRCVVNGSGGSGGSGGGGGGSVLSVFGRTGAILKQSGDYAFGDISGTVAVNQLPSGIDATKIGAGTVDSTRFDFLSTLTGNVQSQLDTKAAVAHSHTAAGDASGDLSNITVTGLQNRPVSNVAPSSGQVLAWNASSARWEPQTVLAGGSAVSMGLQLGDFGVVRTGAQTLQIGGACSASARCNVRLGNTTYSFTQSSILTIGGSASGNGTVYIYIARSGVLTAGYNFPGGGTLACGNCTVQSGVTGFPSDALPLYTWTATWITSQPAVFDANGGEDQRALLSAGKTIAPGVGLIAADVGPTTTVALDTTVVGLRVAVPATATSACDSGSWAADASYLYICFQANSWRRVAVTSW